MILRNNIQRRPNRPHTHNLSQRILITTTVRSRNQTVSRTSVTNRVNTPRNVSTNSNNGKTYRRHRTPNPIRRHLTSEPFRPSRTVRQQGRLTRRHQAINPSNNLRLIRRNTQHTIKINLKLRRTKRSQQSRHRTQRTPSNVTQRMTNSLSPTRQRPSRHHIHRTPIISSNNRIINRHIVIVTNIKLIQPTGTTPIVTSSTVTHIRRHLNLLLPNINIRQPTISRRRKPTLPPILSVRLRVITNPRTNRHRLLSTSLPKRHHEQPQKSLPTPFAGTQLSTVNRTSNRTPLRSNQSGPREGAA